eukprot:4331798-Amphidinium_carterae.1
MCVRLCSTLKTLERAAVCALSVQSLYLDSQSSTPAAKPAAAPKVELEIGQDHTQTTSGFGLHGAHVPLRTDAKAAVAAPKADAAKAELQ